MIIALDYDDTFTADKELWTWFVDRARKSGHEVSFVTFRHKDNPARGNNDDILEDSRELGIPIIFTGGQQKKHHFRPDIWIDDMPILIPTYHELTDRAQGCKNSGDIETRIYLGE
jgi:hypothetical protein